MLGSGTRCNGGCLADTSGLFRLLQAKTGEAWDEQLAAGVIATCPVGQQGVDGHELGSHDAALGFLVGHVPDRAAERGAEEPLGGPTAAASPRAAPMRGAALAGEFTAALSGSWRKGTPTARPRRWNATWLS